MELIENAFRGDGFGSLFHQRAFFEMHAGGQGRYFEAFKSGRLQLCMHLTPEPGGGWRSPLRGTYAGYACSDELETGDWLALHREIEARAAAAGARRLELLLAPQAHDEELFARQLYVLASTGFTASRTDLNYAMKVDASPLEDRMASDHRRRWNNLARPTVRGAAPQELPALYDVVRENYAAKGYPLSMTLPQLQQMQTAFPERMRLFACEDGHRLIGAAICLQLSPRVLYIFYWSALPETAGLNPMIALAHEIYRHCQERGIALLDCGTSTEGAAPNEGLMRFKRQLGFRESLKVRMHKELVRA